MLLMMITQKIVCISENDIEITEDYQNIFQGPYKEIKVEERDFKKMVKSALNKKRKSLTNVLKKVHEDNKGVLDISQNFTIKVRGHFSNYNEQLDKSSVWRNNFRNNAPILE